MLIDNNPPAHPRNLALAGGDGWRRVNDFDLSLGESRPGAGEPDRRRLTGGSPGRPASTPASSSRRAATSPRCADVRLPRRRRLHAAGLAARRSRQRVARVGGRRSRCASTTCRRGSPSSRPGRRRDSRQRSAPSVTDAHSGPASGRDPLPAARRRAVDRAADQARAGRRRRRRAAGRDDARRPRPRHLRLPRRRGRRGRQHRLDHAARRRHRDGAAQGRRRRPRGTCRPRPAATPRAKTRVFARLRWRHRRGPQRHRAVRRRARRSAAACSTPTAPASPAAGCGSSRGPRAAPSPAGRVDTVRTGSHGGFRLALPAGPSRRITVSFARRRRARRLAPAGPGAAGARRASRSTPRRRPCAPASRCASGAGCGPAGAPLPRRGKLVAIQYYETAARRWRPVLVTRSDHSGRFRARYRFRYISGTARIRLRAVALAEERWPYAPGASAR